MMRPSVSLARLRLRPESAEVLHFPRGGGDVPGSAPPERIDAMEYVARVLSQIPLPRKHLVRYHGFHSNAARGKRRRDQDTLVESNTAEQNPAPPPAAAALRKRWADLLRRVYEVDPLVCPRCGGAMHVIGFVTGPVQIKRILDHLRRRDQLARPPPHAGHPVASTA